MIKQYKNWLIINGATHNTIRNYLSKVKCFLKFIKNKEITEERIRDFILHIQETRTSATRNLYRNAINSYLKFLKKHIELPKNLIVDTKLPEYISEEVFKTEIIPMVERISKNALKVKALLYFMFYTGLRKEEITQLRRENINLEERRVKIHMTKSKTERLIVFTNTTRDLLGKYFSTETEEKNAFNITERSIRSICDNLKPYFEDINIHPHLFRHSFASHLRKKGLPIADIQYLMGHKNQNTTMRYAHTDITDLQARYDEKINRSK